MTNEELDEARAKEAGGDPVKAARLARENWTPPEPVDPDVLAFREWFAQRAGSAPKSGILAGHWDSTSDADAFLAGARMARERDAKMTAEEKLLRAIFGPTGRPAKEADQ